PSIRIKISFYLYVKIKNKKNLLHYIGYLRGKRQGSQESEQQRPVAFLLYTVKVIGTQGYQV
ncbi:MAG: hypothetical protein WBS20_02580, partial [Lysobacterales bacterium]